MDPQQTITIDATKPLSATPERDVTFQLPAVVSDRLDRLVRSLEREGFDARGQRVKQRTTTRKELLGALILAADERTLERLLSRYRAARAGDALIPAKERGRFRVPARSPGIRPTSEQDRKRRTPDRRPPRRNRYSELRSGTSRTK